MKWKNKVFSLSLLASLTTVTPLSTVLTSCNKTDFYSSMEQDVLNYFYWICSHYRKTYYNIAFCDDLCFQIKNKLGFEVVKDDISSKHRKTALDPGRYSPNVTSPYGYNFYFDIPANIKGNYPNIIIQAHTDMVCDIKTDESGKPIEYDWSQGIVPVIETINGKRIMHSKDNNTSLGADDGIGLASILAIAKHQSEFPHGKIRCLFTVDEEDGDSGAKYLWHDWLRDAETGNFQYYLSLDGEILQTTWTSSGGASQVVWEYEDPNGSTVTASGKEITISMANFIGGHSALKLPDRRVSPTVLLGFVLEALSKKVTNLRLVECYDGKSSDSDPNAGTIPNKITFTVQGTTDLTKDAVIQLLKDLLTDLTKDNTYWFGGEKDNLPNIFQTLDTGVTVKDVATSTEGLTPEATTKVMKFLVGEYEDASGNKIRSYQKYSLYGASKFLSEEIYPPDTYPEIGGNIGAIRLGSKVKSGAAHKIHFDFMGRAAYQDEDRHELSEFYYDDWDGVTPKSGTMPQKETYKTRYANAVKDAFGLENNTIPGTWTDAGYNLPWLRPKTGYDNFIKLIKKAGEETGTPMLEAPVFGWMEIGEIWQTTQKMGITDIQYGSLGPQLTDVHTINECLEVDTIVPMLKMVVYVLTHLKDVY